jgi:hypothetical protein
VIVRLTRTCARDELPAVAAEADKLLRPLTQTSPASSESS